MSRETEPPNWDEALIEDAPDPGRFKSRTYLDRLFPMIRCKVCGNDSFRIGQEDFETLTQCTRCGTECKAHTG